ncbi:tRNA (guanosine(46)-N7)-methyltransferase TrmB [Singulisphaera sp. PoT]|uniref:tRNA (guanosine(46)-N7)-methyltransferase TrmB n=1 Tax=Singulisphaera sp. PoT TaxID=3411797 RepID=UPI003BF5786F
MSQDSESLPGSVDESPSPIVPVSKPRPRPDLHPYWVERDQLPGPVTWSKVFHNENPVEVEIGSGKGLFLINAATANPARNYFGIELARKFALKGAEKIAKRELANVRMLSADALLFMARQVPTASLHAVHVYFPDPWWKKRHKKRRVFGEPLVNDIERTLIPGGDLWIATDVEEYFGVMRSLMATRPLFEEVPMEEPKAPEHDHDYLTNFERKYRIEGRPIYRTHYQRT